MGIVDLVFPKKCLGCGKGGVYICRNCIGKQPHAKPICPMCEKPSVDGMTHIKCKKKLGLDGLVSIWKYSGVIRKAIIKLKYSFVSDLVDELVKVVIDEINNNRAAIAVPKSSVLIPVPLFWYKKNYRGFNQSEELGKRVASSMELKFVGDLVIRKKNTKSQTELKGKQRRKNIVGAFLFNKKYDINGTNIIVIDDVYTTGSTVKEVCKVLKRNGANKVWGVTLAR